MKDTLNGSFAGIVGSCPIVASWMPSIPSVGGEGSMASTKQPCGRSLARFFMREILPNQLWIGDVGDVQ